LLRSTLKRADKCGKLQTWSKKCWKIKATPLKEISIKRRFLKSWEKTLSEMLKISNYGHEEKIKQNVRRRTPS